MSFIFFFSSTTASLPALVVVWPTEINAGGKNKTRKQTAGLIDVGSFFCGFSCYSVFRLVACDSCTAPGAVCICSKPRYLASLIAMHRHNECNEDGADDGQRSSSSSSSNLLVWSARACLVSYSGWCGDTSSSLAQSGAANGIEHGPIRRRPVVRDWPLMKRAWSDQSCRPSQVVSAIATATTTTTWCVGGDGRMLHTRHQQSQFGSGGSSQTGKVIGAEQPASWRTRGERNTKISLDRLKHYRSHLPPHPI